MKTADAFQRLARANPVPAPDDPQLVSRAAALARDSGSVSVATSPAPRRRRGLRLLVAVTLAIGLFLAVAPALGLRLPALDFWSSEPAPTKIVREFETLDLGAPIGMEVDVIAGETRKVTLTELDGTRHTLYLAPTRHGGFCTRGETTGGCDKLGTVPLSVSQLPDAIQGFASSDYSDSVEVQFADGEHAKLRVTWISEPIGAGFFVYRIPQDRQFGERKLESVTARNSDGEVVAMHVFDRSRISGAPAEALQDDKHAVFQAITSSGPATYWLARTRYEGRCAWLEVAGRSGLISRCLPRGYETSPGVGVSFVPLKDDVLIAGEFDPRFRFVDVLYDDGTVERAEPREGLLLHHVTAAHFARGAESTELVGRRGDGTVIVRVPIPTALGIGDPCRMPLPLGPRAASCR